MQKLTVVILAVFMLGSLSYLTSCKKTATEEEPKPGLADDWGDEPLPYLNTSWMADLENTRCLYELSIPGTHDAAADEHTSEQGSADDPYVVCQDYYIAHQMMLGVRWFDIRLHLDISDGVLTAFHSAFYLHKNFNDLLKAGLDFLEAYPTETLVFMIKQEHSSETDDDFGAAVYKYLKGKSPDLSKFYLGPDMPQLGKVRGKIVIVSRYLPLTNNNRGIYLMWDDNTKGENVDQGDYPIWAQDHYSLNTVSFSTKCDEIKSGISGAQNSGNKRLYLNFTSGEADQTTWTIYGIAYNINPVIVSYLKSHPDWLHLGVLFVNFAGGSDSKDGNGNRTASPEFVQEIINHNDKSIGYLTVGSQKWMARDLCTKVYRNGDSIPHITDPTAWSTTHSGAYCEYNNEVQGAYGYLYNWHAVNDPRGLCPEGWHVPSKHDWDVLINYLGPDGGILKEAGTKHWVSPNYGAYNGSGFTALPGGARFYEGTFDLIGYTGFWWTTDESNGKAPAMILINTDNIIQWNDYVLNDGFSVRCIHD